MKTLTFELTIEELKIVLAALRTEELNLHKDMESRNPDIRDYANAYAMKFQPVAIRADRLYFSNI
jgi:hypothetical protein